MTFSKTWADQPLPVGFSGAHPLNDLQAALVALQDGGATREEAMSAILSDPGITERLADKISAVRARFDSEVEERTAAAAAKTPEGRAKAAAAAAKAKAEKAEQAANARVLLEEASGLDVSDLSDDDALKAAGLVPKTFADMSMRERDRELETFAADLPSMTREQRLGEAQRLGIDVGTVERYSRDFLGLTVDSTLVDGSGDEGGEGDGS